MSHHVFYCSIHLSFYALHYCVRVSGVVFQLIQVFDVCENTQEVPCPLALTLLIPLPAFVLTPLTEVSLSAGNTVRRAHELGYIVGVWRRALERVEKRRCDVANLGDQGDSVDGDNLEGDLGENDEEVGDYKVLLLLGETWSTCWHAPKRAAPGRLVVHPALLLLRDLFVEQDAQVLAVLQEDIAHHLLCDIDVGLLDEEGVLDRAARLRRVLEQLPDVGVDVLVPPLLNPDCQLR